jgi:hypothetical protein
MTALPATKQRTSRKSGSEQLISTSCIALVIATEQTRHLTWSPHTQSPGNPGKGHRGFAPEPSGNPYFPAIALPASLQVCVAPSQFRKLFPNNSLGLSLR